MKYILFILAVLMVACHTSIDYPAGGYDYPETVANADTLIYFYPLKDSGSKREIFLNAYTYFQFKPFDEKNLSLKPLEKETFRLTYANAFGETCIFILTEKCITVKQGNSYNAIAYDTSKLNAIENQHLRLLERRYPLEDAGSSKFWKQYIDSMVKQCPQLLDVKYYHSLTNRTLSFKKGFKYEVSTVNISKKDYTSIINDINASGYWTMPYQVNCDQMMADGDGFTLEANTKNKYKVVNAQGCPGDSTLFTKACQRIIDFTNMKDKINLVWDGKIEISDKPLETTDVELEDVKPEKTKHK